MSDERMKESPEEYDSVTMQILSDARMKRAEKVVSDRRMKRLARSMVRQYGERHRNSMTPSSGIINACKEGC